MNIFESKCFNAESNIDNRCDSISCVWPRIESPSNSYKSKLKSPNFRRYIFRDLPPSTVTEYIPISLQDQDQCGKHLSQWPLYVYTPAFDPPNWPIITQETQLNVFFPEKTVERLTLKSLTQKSLQLYDYSGDFYLKIFILECYGT